MPEVTKDISAEDTFSDALRVKDHFNISIAGTFSATVTVQRSLDGTTWRDVDDFTSTTETYGFDPEPFLYRVGVKSGNYTSGTASVRLGDPDYKNQ
jgi:hypothetical protein